MFNEVNKMRVLTLFAGLFLGFGIGKALLDVFGKNIYLTLFFDASTIIGIVLVIIANSKLANFKK